jgi:XRE family transcriptional regulator of biofilm formation
MGVRKITKRGELLGKHIAKLRKKKGFTQEQFAEQVGISLTWLSYIEIGYNKPSLGKIYKMAKVLGVKVSDIFPF